MPRGRRASTTFEINLVDNASRKLNQLAAATGSAASNISQHFSKMSDAGHKAQDMGMALRKIAGSMQNMDATTREWGQSLEKSAQKMVEAGIEQQQFADAVIHSAKSMGVFIKEKEKEIKTLKKEETRMDSAIKGMKSFSKAMSGAGSKIRALSRAMIWTGRDLTVLSGIVLGFGVVAMRSFAEVETSAANLQLALQFQGAGLQDAIDSVQVLSRAASELGEAYGFSAGVAIDATRIMVMTGLDAEEAAELQEKAMQLARGTGLDLNRAVELLVGTMNAYGMSVSEAAHVADIMTVANFSTMSSISEVADGMTHALGMANRWGISLEDLTAAMTLIDRTGLSMSIGGRALSSMFSTLATKGEDYGIQVFDLYGNMLPLSDIIENTRRAMDRYAESNEEGAMLSALFGDTEAKAMQALLNQQGALNELADAYENSGGAAETAAETQLDTLQGKLDLLTAAAKNLLDTFGKELNKVFNDTGAWDTIIGFVQDLDDDVAALAKAFGENLVPAVQSAIEWLKKAWQWYQDNKEAINGVIGMLVKLALAAAAVGPALMVLGTILEPLALTFSIIGGAGGAISGAATALSGLDLAAAGASIGITSVAGAFGALALAVTAALVILGGVSGFFEGATGAADGLSGAGMVLKRVLDLLWGILKPVLTVIGAIAGALFEMGRFVGLIIGQFVNFIGTMELGRSKTGEVMSIFSAFGAIVAGVTEFLGWLADSFAEVMGAWKVFNDIIADVGFLEVLRLVIVGIQSGINEAIRAVQGFMGVIGQLLAPVSQIAGMFDTIVGTIFGRSPGLIPGFEALIGLAAPLMGAFAGISNIMGGLGDAAGGLVEGLGGVIKGAQEAIGEPIVEAVTDIQGGINNAITGVQGATDEAIKGAQDTAKATADAVQGVLCGLFGCSPGIIPGLSIVKDLLDEVSSGMSDMEMGGGVIAEVGGGGGALGGPITVNIYVGAGDNAEETGRLAGEGFVAVIRGEQRRQLGGPYG